MGLKDLNDPNAVSKAIDEYDALGQDAFLKRYGFGRARTFVLLRNGKSYDSKAIVGAAHGYQYGRPLRAEEFSGGTGTVVPLLKRLGYEVVAHDLDDTSSALPEEVPETAWEGARRSITVNQYERNPSARAGCIEHHGSECAICGFSFAEEYGDAFKGFIHVHHLVPLAKIGERYCVNPKNDLLPVCPNCHAVLHYGGNVRTPQELRELRKKAKLQVRCK